MECPALDYSTDPQATRESPPHIRMQHDGKYRNEGGPDTGPCPCWQMHRGRPSNGGTPAHRGCAVRKYSGAHRSGWLGCSRWWRRSLVHWLGSEAVRSAPAQRDEESGCQTTRRPHSASSPNTVHHTGHRTPHRARFPHRRTLAESGARQEKATKKKKEGYDSGATVPLAEGYLGRRPC